jgi:hypothetical protein
LLSYAFLERHFRESKWIERIQALQVDDGLKKWLRDNLRIDEAAGWMPAYWAGCVIIFCGCNFWGTDIGDRKRRPPDYPQLSEMISQAQIQTELLAPLDRALLANLRFQLQEFQITESDAIAIFREIIGPSLADDRLTQLHKLDAPDDQAWYRRHLALHQVIADILANVNERKGAVPTVFHASDSCQPLPSTYAPPSGEK